MPAWVTSLNAQLGRGTFDGLKRTRTTNFPHIDGTSFGGRARMKDRRVKVGAGCWVAWRVTGMGLVVEVGRVVRSSWSSVDRPGWML